MRPILFTLLAFVTSTACTKKAPSHRLASDHDEEAAYSVNPKFAGAASVIVAARKVFPESAQISLLDFWTSTDATHEFVVFFAGREAEVGFESMYWRYLVFAKNKNDRDWADARAFEIAEDHPEPFRRSLAWLEANAKEFKAPNSERSASP